MYEGIILSFIDKFGSLSLSVQSSTQEIGREIQLTCTVTGAPTYAIRWLREGTIISPSCKYSIASSDTNMSVLSIHDVSLNDDGDYECIAHSYYTESVNEIITVNAQSKLNKLLFIFILAFLFVI